MNVIARLEYELAYYDSAVHRFNHYTTRTPLRICSRERVLFPSSFFFMHFVIEHVVLPCSSTDSDTALKKSRFILSDSSDFHMIDNLPRAFQAFAMCVLTARSVDEILQPRYEILRLHAFLNVNLRKLTVVCKRIAFINISTSILLFIKLFIVFFLLV